MRVLRLLAVVALLPGAFAQTLRLYSSNPHYFEYLGKPTLLITSGEHYGAVLNRDFDYRKYLDTIARDGLNLTRVFAGTYREQAGASFGIARNTLAPGPDAYLAPGLDQLYLGTPPAGTNSTSIGGIRRISSG